jgi:acyl carrier protein phosphodiesterase
VGLAISGIAYLQYIVPVNYLAHAYLSFDHPEVLTGNMISDFIKGKKKYDYPPAIQAGINLHRAIDGFTDDHPVTKTAKMVFRPAYGLYCAAFMDVTYDHFLAKELAVAGQEAFSSFTENVYRQLKTYEPLFPQPFRDMYPYMKRQDWLYNYQFTEGIANSFEGLVRRAAYISDSGPAIAIFEKHYEALGGWYREFFPSLKKFSLDSFHELIDKNNF